MSQKKCPASGCNKWFSRDDLKSNKDLEKRVKAAARRLRAQEEDEDDDDADMVVD
jgi:E3 SUMO-protein ligase NSE2